MSADQTSAILEKSKEMGATMAGIASVEILKKSPSHQILNMKTGLEIKSFAGINWPPDARSALVIALSHPEDKPELDWWDTNSSEGNTILIKICRELSEWIHKELKIKTYLMPYSVERGGIYLKDASVLAGLGCIGKNNLLITPEFGPRIRLRGILLTEELTQTGPVAFDPCEGCQEFCRKACPQNAFAEKTLSSLETGLNELPGRDGFFSRERCMVQMRKDMEESDIDFNRGVQFISDTEDMSTTEKLVKYCRKCEFACPVGK